MDAINEKLRDIGLCVGFLTRLPAPLDPRGRELAEIAWGFPIVGIAVGALTAIVYAASFWVGLTPFVAACLAAAASVIATGGFHEDGLADTADGIGGGRDRDHRLQIMRDSRIGVFGAAAVGLVLLLRIGALSAMGSPGAVALASVAAAVTSRAFMVPLMTFLPAARADGLGAHAGRPSRTVTAAALAIALILVFAALPSAPAMICLAGAATGACAVALIALRRLGGQTGDILGAAQQTAEITALLALTPALMTFSL